MGDRSVGSAPTGFRTVVITGGNSGLGFASAKAILEASHGAPWHVVLACRDEGRARSAVDQLIGCTNVVGQVDAMRLNLASLASVRAFAAELTKRLRTGTLPPLHAVVCNAGINPGTTKTITADGFDSTFGVNHLGHFLLVNELLPMLQLPRGCRRQRRPRSGAEVRSACTRLERPSRLGPRRTRCRCRVRQIIGFGSAPL